MASEMKGLVGTQEARSRAWFPGLSIPTCPDTGSEAVNGNRDAKLDSSGSLPHEYKDTKVQVQWSFR